jgi:hypothetical protein
VLEIQKGACYGYELIRRWWENKKWKPFSNNFLGFLILLLGG